MTNRKKSSKEGGKNMENVLRMGLFSKKTTEKEEVQQAVASDKLNLLDAVPGVTYNIKEINTEDEDMNAFLFRLGCYTGEPVTLISKKKKNCIVVIKDGRYNLDNLLAEAIIVE